MHGNSLTTISHSTFISFCRPLQKLRYQGKHCSRGHFDLMPQDLHISRLFKTKSTIQCMYYNGREPLKNGTERFNSLDVFHLPNNSGNSGWNVNGTRLFGSFHWTFSGINGFSEKVVPFSRRKLPKGKFVFHLQISRLYCF